MAVPQIVTVTPTRVSTLGQSVIQILGFNFRTPTPPPPGFPVPVRPPSVQTTVGGLAADTAVASGGRLIVTIPPHAEGDVDIIVQNIDDDGDPIVGETDTATDALSYRYTPLTTQRDLTRLMRALIQMMRDQIHPNIVPMVNSDFSITPYTRSYIAEIPSVVVLGPELSANKVIQPHGLEVVNPVGREFDMRRAARVVDVGFDLLGVSDSSIELLNLLDTTETFIHGNNFLAYTDSEGTAQSLQLDFQVGGDLRATSEPNESNLREFRGEIVVREFPVKGAIVAMGATVFDDIVLEQEGFVGENLTDPITGEDLGLVPLPAYQGGPLKSPSPTRGC